MWFSGRNEEMQLDLAREKMSRQAFKLRANKWQATSITLSVLSRIVIINLLFFLNRFITGLIIWNRDCFTVGIFLKVEKILYFTNNNQNTNSKGSFVL